MVSPTGQQGALSPPDNRNIKNEGSAAPRLLVQTALRQFISFAFQIDLEGSGVGGESMTAGRGAGGSGGVSCAAYEQLCPAATVGLLKYYLLFFLMSSPSSSWR